jgi:hypothetical protein
MTLARRIPAALTLALVLLGASNAAAYCRTNSCDPSRGEQCSLDNNGCTIGGLDLAWVSSCVTFGVQREGSVKNNISPEAFETAIAESFKTWMNAACSEGTTPSILVQSIGQVECKNVEYNKDQGNANIYMFQDDEWTASGQGNALALTTVWYDWKTGEIYDADVEVNGTGGDITNGAPEDGADLLSIVTHESGHFLGLAHSPFNPKATMYTVYDPGRGNLRNLSQDDIDGICAVYPPDREAKTDNCDPRHGFQSHCWKEDDGCGCRTAPGRVQSASGLVMFGLALTGLLSRRRRRLSA